MEQTEIKCVSKSAFIGDYMFVVCLWSDGTVGYFCMNDAEPGTSSSMVVYLPNGTAHRHDHRG